MKYVFFYRTTNQNDQKAKVTIGVTVSNGSQILTHETPVYATKFFASAVDSVKAEHARLCATPADNANATDAKIDMSKYDGCGVAIEGLVTGLAYDHRIDDDIQQAAKKYIGM